MPSERADRGGRRARLGGVPDGRTRRRTTSATSATERARRRRRRRPHARSRLTCCPSRRRRTSTSRPGTTTTAAIRARELDRLALIHFGVHEDVAAHLDAAGRRARLLGRARPRRDRARRSSSSGARRRRRGRRHVRPRRAVLAVVAGPAPLLGHARQLTRLGPLHEREFRLLFAGRTISCSAAPWRRSRSRSPSSTRSTAPRPSRHRPRRPADTRTRAAPLRRRLGRPAAAAYVMVASNLLSGASQATTAALLLSGHATLWELAPLAAVNGSATAFFYARERRDRPPDGAGRRCCSRRTRHSGCRSTPRTSSARPSEASSSRQRAPAGRSRVDAASYGLAALATRR